MKAPKQIGIWMDHSVANMIEFTDEKMIKKTLKVSPVFLGPLDNLRWNENGKNNNTKSHLSEFYKKISDEIKDFDEVLIYGPTNAKTELFNQLKENVHFDRIKIEVRPSDKMTENQQETYVKRYFDLMSK